MPSLVAAMAAASVSSLSSVALTDLLRSNDKTIWKLKLYKPPRDHFDSFEAFCEALSQNETVTTVEVSWTFLRHLTNANRLVLLETIGSLPRLVALATEVVGPSNGLTAALRHATNLQSLRMRRLRFLTNQDVQGLAAALRGCRELRQINLSSVQFVVEGDQVDADGVVWFQNTQQQEAPGQKIVLDPLLDAMAALPVLEHIRLQHYLNGSRIQTPSQTSLRSLCHAPRRSLVFNSCGLLDEQCATIADELKSNNASPNLSVLVVTRNYEISPFGWDSFIDMLTKNDTVLDFHHGEEGQRNPPSPEQLAKIRYYLKLNQAGRGLLSRGSMTERRKAWYNFLVEGSNDLDKVFFAMQADPSLYTDY